MEKTPKEERRESMPWLIDSPGIAYSHVLKSTRPELYIKSKDTLIDSYDQHQQFYGPPQRRSQQQAFVQQQASPMQLMQIHT
jgi:hypothetical protein